MRLYTALCTVLEAKARLINEEANTVELGTYARGLEDGRNTALEQFGIDVEYEPVGDDEDEDGAP
ncbi:hypothetical protein [Arthrobacter sp. MDT1-65]